MLSPITVADRDGPLTLRYPRGGLCGAQRVRNVTVGDLDMRRTLATLLMAALVGLGNAAPAAAQYPGEFGEFTFGCGLSAEAGNGAGGSLDCGATGLMPFTLARATAEFQFELDVNGAAAPGASDSAVAFVGAQAQSGSASDSDAVDEDGRAFFDIALPPGACLSCPIIVTLQATRADGTPVAGETNARVVINAPTALPRTPVESGFPWMMTVGAALIVLLLIAVVRRRPDDEDEGDDGTQLDEPAEVTG